MKRVSLYVIVLMFASVLGHAEVRVSALFSDNMVLQRDIAAPVWGLAASGEAVTVNIGAIQASTQADAEGRWRVNLPAMPANANAQDLIIRGGRKNGMLEDSTGTVMMAISYSADGHISIFRNGVAYTDYQRGSAPAIFRGDSVAIFGQRHPGATGHLGGSIDEARIYGTALSAKQIAALYADGPNSVALDHASAKLVHRWSFNDGNASDSIGRADGTLFPGALIRDGKLVLDGHSGYMTTRPIGGGGARSQDFGRVGESR